MFASGAMVCTVFAQRQSGLQSLISLIMASGRPQPLFLIISQQRVKRSMDMPIGYHIHILHNRVKGIGLVKSAAGLNTCQV